MKLLYIVNVDWFFVSHRLPLALAAIEEGAEVHLISAVTNKKKELESYGINVHPIEVTRSGTSILQELKVLKSVNRIVGNIKPDVVHYVSIKAVIYGGLVCKFRRIKKRVAAISGLGYAFIDSSFKANFIKRVALILYQFVLNNDKTTVIFQNPEDRKFFIREGIVNEQQTVLVRGAGVDLNKFKPVEYPSGTPVVMFLGRLLKDKGLWEFYNAAKILYEKGHKARFVVVGDIDEGNPNSLTTREVRDLHDSNIVELWGYSSEVEKVMQKATIIALPSYREGLPKSLLEAAACGRAVVTTDVPGCRDAIVPEQTGLLCNVKDEISLANTLQVLLEDAELCYKLGTEGRKVAEEHFDVVDVAQTHLNIYFGN